MRDLEEALAKFATQTWCEPLAGFMERARYLQLPKLDILSVFRRVSELVPSSFVKSVDPFEWNNEYYLAYLAGTRLNVVRELEQKKVLPTQANFCFEAPIC